MAGATLGPAIVFSRGFDMESLPSAKAREQFAELYDRAAYGKERFIVTKHKKQGVAIVPVEDLRLLEALEDRLDRIERESALKEARTKGTHTLDDVLAEIGLDPSLFRKRGT
jgi:prevent-host-death family protein